MRNFSHTLLAALAVMALFSCSKGTRIHGTVKDAPQSDIVISMLDVNKYKVLDTLKNRSRRIVQVFA